MTAQLPELMPLATVLDWLGVSKSTFNRWARQGAAPPRVKLGNHVLFRADELLAWLDGQRVEEPARPKADPGPYDEWR
ncbi:MAG: helix-turn-helix domain-containing protein [Bifidobacteriaceae bacterium]|jgi:excisionase family DNA binding protein|nr:helix-turn-helix domain-containing protein [Bifidobacteriaceae bacterium]